ncbi:MAG: Lrp/AsnC family transcriptional regulator [Rhodospirillaceae bacterium]|nr:Lrp/AsnC family transcriptional regulator [Rhodospirillaceae bacterium]
MDDLDRRLVGLLRNDGRMPISSIASRLSVSRATAQNRLDRLVKRGDILGFTVKLKGEQAGGVRAITLIEEQAKDVKKVINALRQIPEARAVYTANGRWDLMVEMAAADLGALDNALTLIRSIDRVVSTETIVLLTAHK